MRFDETIDSFLKTSFFVESPMYYEGIFNDNMNDVEHNKEITKKIVSNNNPFEKFENLIVYKISDGFDEDQVTFCIVNNDIVEAFMEIASNKGNHFSRGVWQRKAKENTGLIRRFILEFLPKHYDSIISDKTSNKLGIAFYKRLLSDCTKKGLKVTVLKGSFKNETPFDMEKVETYWHNTEKDIPTHPTFVTNKDELFKIYFQ